MGSNNWKKLEEEIIADRNRDKDQMTKQGIRQSSGLFRFLGDLFELFFPSMIKSLLGSSTEQPQDNK